MAVCPPISTPSPPKRCGRIWIKWLGEFVSLDVIRLPAPTQILGSEAPRTTLLTEHAVGTSSPLAKDFGMCCHVDVIKCNQSHAADCSDMEGHLSLSLSPSLAASVSLCLPLHRQLLVRGTFETFIVNDINPKPVAQCSSLESFILLAPISASKYHLINIKSLKTRAHSNILKS